MKALILGAKGSLGQTFADLYKDHEFFAWDREELDITDEAAVGQKISELKPDLIINCAAYNAVDQAEEDSATAELINGAAVRFLANAAKNTHAILVHYSSAYVFDGNSKEGYNEEDKPNPLSAYAKSKLTGETSLRQNCDDYYLIRTTWLYGRESVTGKESFVDLMLRLAGEGKDIRGIADEFGQPTYVSDLAQATKNLIDQKKPFGVYHLVNEGVASWYDWAGEIFKIKDLPVKVTAGKRSDFNRKALRPQYGILNNTKSDKLRPWTEALKEYLS